ncbi:MAG: glycosyltransferase family 39 protein [Actinomycetota bacterium]|nr:glycosyltransferase family 39 protein [Actinomycetota bacterium]
MSVGTLHPESRRHNPSTRRWRVHALLASPAAGALLALTVLAAVLRFWRIGHQGFWFDEGNTAQLVHFSPGQMLGLIPQSESTPPLYYCVAWVWARIFGYGEAGLRSLSALAGVAVVPVLYGAGSKLVSRRAGVVVAALAACNPLLIWYSQEARSYELLVLLSSLALLAFAHAREEPTTGRLAFWVLCAATALATHYYAVVAIVPQAIWLLAIHRDRRGVRVAVGMVALCGLALVPLAISQSGTGNSSWIAPVPLGRRLSQVAPQFLTGFQLPAQSLLSALAGALALGGLALVLWRGDEHARRAAIGVGGLVVSGVVLDLILIAGGIDDLITRNLLALWPAAALAVAVGLATPRARLVGVLAAAALCAIGVTGAVAIALNRDYQRPDWRGVAQLLGPGPAPGSGARVILVQHYRDLLPLSLYLSGLKFLPGRGALVRELDVVAFTSPPSGGFCWWGTACNLWPSTMQASYPIAGFRAVRRRHIHQFTVLRMVSGSPVLVTPQGVTHLLRTTRLRNDGLLLQR